MKKQIVFVPGGTAFSKYESFIDYLKTQPMDNPFEINEMKRWQSALREILLVTHEVAMLSMPNKQNAHYEEWKICFERHFQFVHDGVILVGHSLGGYFLVKYLSENKIPFHIGSLLLLAAPFQNEDFGGEDGGDFAFDPKNLVRVSEQVKDIHLFHSIDDPIVSYSHALQYVNALPGSELHTFPDKNHFILEEFPEFLELLQKI
jgi:uncharacterized protein